MNSRVKSLLWVSAGALSLAACSEPNSPAEPARSLTTLPTGGPRSDGFIVILKSSASLNLSRMKAGGRLADYIRLDRAAGSATVTDVVPRFNAVAIRGPSNAASITGDDVAAVFPNFVAEIVDPVVLDESKVAALELNDPLGTDQSSASLFAANWQWDYKRISVNRVWAASRGGAGANVCIIDSGIDAGFVSFGGKSIVSTSFVPNSSAQTDTNGHGSHVAGTVSTNGIGLASTAPDANLMTAKVFAGSGSASTTAVWNGIIWCTDNGADVINMSLGVTGGVPTTPGNQPFIDFYQTVLDYATSAGVLIVASAGNDAATLPVAGRKFIPAEMGGVTSVAATAPTTNLSPFGMNAVWSAPGAAFDGIASYSNRGPVPSVDISAPGGDLFAGWPAQSLIVSACSRQFRSGSSFPCAGGGSVLFAAGTSQAAPHVSGVAAIIRARWPSSVRSAALRNKIEACLYRSVDNVGPTTTFGRGRLNAFKAATMPC